MTFNFLLPTPVTPGAYTNCDLTVNASGRITAIASGASPLTGTQGSVIHLGVGGASAEDNANFFYDLTNKRLGVGTAVPSTTIEAQAAAGSAGTMTLSTAELTVVATDVLGQINFQAPLESSGTDSILVAASIYAEAEATFDASTNSTGLVFATGTSETAAERMRIDADGQVGIGITPTETLHVAGSIGLQQVTIDNTDSPYTVLSTDHTIIANAASGAITINLPASASSDDRVLVIKKIDASNDVTIDGNSAETVDGAATLVLDTQYESSFIQCDGSNWHRLGGGLSAGGFTGTTGSVPFVDGGGALTEDNANFFYDDTAEFLGIGINSSLGAHLHIQTSGTTVIGQIIQATALQSVNLQEWQDENGTPGAVVTELLRFSNPTGGLLSESFGSRGNVSTAQSVTVHGTVTCTQGTSMGYNATATGPGGCSAFGWTATASGNQCTAFGWHARATNTNANAFGWNTLASGSGSMAIGGNSQATQLQSTAIGVTAQATGLGAFSLGNASTASGTNGAMAIGTNAQATKTGVGGSMAIGLSANSAFDRAICIGSSSATTAADQFVVGSNSWGIRDIYLGTGVTAATPLSSTHHATGGSGTDIAAADYTIAGGIATGDAAGGDIIFQTSDAGASSSTPQTLTTKASVTADGFVVAGLTAGSMLFVGASGEIAEDTPGAFYDSANSRVGLGTATPSVQIEVQAAAGSAGTMTLSTAELTVVATDVLGQINFQAPLESSGLDAILVGASIWAEAEATFGTTDNSTSLVFATGTSQTAFERMRLDSNGRLGIGVSVPYKQLHVHELSTGIAEVHITNTTSGTLASDGLGVGYYSGGAYVWNYEADNLAFATSNSQRMTIDAAGLVGINDTTPSAQLHVKTSGIGVIGAIFQASAGQTANILEVRDSSDIVGPRVTAAGHFSNIGGQTSSEVFGDGATVSGASATAFGFGANAVIQGVAVGGAATATATNCIAVGILADAGGTSAIAIGAVTDAGGLGSIVVGSLGAAAGDGGIALGASTVAAHTGAICMGTGATSTAAKQLVIGGADNTYEIDDVYIGAGVTDATPPSVTIQTTGGVGTDIAAGNLTLAGGKGTGDAAGGDIFFQTSDAGGSGTTPQTLTTKASVTADGFVGRDAVGISDTAEGNTARLTLKTTHETHTLSLATTSDTTTISIPAGALLRGVSFNVNTAVTDGGGDDTWSAAFITGSTTTIATGQAAALDTKVDEFIVVPEVATATTEIQFTPNGGSFTAGVIEIVAYYEELTSLANV